MLNRKLSNYLFYAILIAITGVVLLIRSVTLGGINDRIALLETSNITLQQQNDALETQVEQYKDVQINHLYELYGKVPSYYSQTDLTYYTIAQLELLGITEAVDFQRRVYVDAEITFEEESVFGLLSKEFKIVQVQVYFTTLDASLIEEFIDSLYNSEQIFIVDSVEYTTPDGVNYIGVKIDFLAFYDLEEEIIEEAS